MAATLDTTDSSDRPSAVWPDYYRVTVGQRPCRALLEALSRLNADMAQSRPRRAVDLGCVAGNETVELLRRGWSVIAIDKTPQAIEYLLQRPDLPGRDHLETVVTDLADAAWPAVDLAHARASLPFLPPSAFAVVWSRIVASLASGGYFAGDFFGDRDDWASLPGRTHHTHGQVIALLEPFDVELLGEIERDGQTALGVPKHWHRFEVVARKR